MRVKSFILDFFLAVLGNAPREVGRCYFYPEKIEWYFLGRKVYSEASLNSRKFPLSSLPRQFYRAIS